MHKRVKTKTGEDLSDANIAKVISLLENKDKKITKKEACELLHITYNTTRLDTIITNYKDKQQSRKELRAKRRGKPPTDDEISCIIRDYLEGDPISKISEKLYRGTFFVKNVIKSQSLPERVPGATFWKDIPLIPEKARAESFSDNEVVYSARYHSLAIIKGKFVDKKKQEVYRIFVLGEDNQFMAYQPAYDLASLKHLGIKF